MEHSEIKIYLIEPRGFCAGVTRAIDIVERAISKFGTPLYVRHEIVHNQRVVQDLINKGVIFVEQLSEVPDNGVVIFSAHGISEAVEQEAIDRKLNYIDATCPLVKKVHNEGQKFANDDNHIILIGHRGHPEMEGTAGRIKGKVSLVTSIEEAKTIQIEKTDKIAYITQTTLSVDDTKEIIDILKERFPNTIGGQNICYATTNRQNAIKSVLHKIDGMIVMGSKKSSNSNRLREIGENQNIPSILIDSAESLNEEWLKNKNSLAISAGASAPEITVQETIEKIKKYKNVSIESVVVYEENVVFAIPKELR